jgi:hypothetical protein
MSGFESSLSPHIRLGLQCRELNRLRDAERHFKDALAEDPMTTSPFASSQ